eukprot:2541572-Pyramimonas_sp.AAC.1
MRQDSLMVFHGGILKRQIMVSGGGPPYETWSAARWSEQPGPPPLRSHDHFWGVAHAAPQQRVQLAVGNALMQSMVLLLAAHLAAGAAGWSGHPIPCSWRLAAVTSWTWGPWLALQSAPCTATADFDQCEHGQLSRAPTRLFGPRMAGLH